MQPIGIAYQHTTSCLKTYSSDRRMSCFQVCC